MWMKRSATELLDPASTLPGRPQAIMTPGVNLVLATPMALPFPAGIEVAIFAMGCFWGAERVFWQIPGVYTTAVGYSAGQTPNPSYEEVCSGSTNHAEAVLVGFDPSLVNFRQLLSQFFEGHDPTQGFRQGNDHGSQYRSVIVAQGSQQEHEASEVLAAYQELLLGHGLGPITTTIERDQVFYFAEDYHQQYLAKNPDGYCGLGSTGLSCPVGIEIRPAE